MLEFNAKEFYHAANFLKEITALIERQAEITAYPSIEEKTSVGADDDDLIGIVFSSLGQLKEICSVLNARVAAIAH
jgi:hypothetical protein